MKRYLVLFALLFTVASEAAVNTYVLTVTNIPVTGNSVTAGGRTRTWTNAVSATTILTNLVGLGPSASNLFSAFGAYPQSAFSVRMSDTNALTFTGYDLVVYQTGNWASVTTNSSAGTNTYAIHVPPDNIPTVATRTNNANYISEYLSEYSGTRIDSNSVAMGNFVSISTNAQTVLGAKTFWSMRGTNTAYIAGGIYLSPFISGPTTTNLVNYGNAVSSPGAGTGSEQFGTSASATGNQSLAVGNTATATNASATAIGYSAIAGGDSSTAIGQGANAIADYAVALGSGAIAGASDAIAAGTGAEANNIGAIAIGTGASSAYHYSIALGNLASTSTSNQIVLGTSSYEVRVPGRLTGTTTNVTMTGATNRLNGAIGFTPAQTTSLTAGNNAGVAHGDRSILEITTGPGGAFTICGIAAGYSGQLLTVVNFVAQNMTIAHESGVEPTAANRIITSTGADRATTAAGVAQLYYSGTSNRWVLVNLDP